MSEKGGAYEHGNQMNRGGPGDNTPTFGGDNASDAQVGNERNEINLKDRNRDLPDAEEVRQPGKTHPHGPETHQDTKFTRKSGE